MSSAGLVGKTAVVDENTALVQLMLDSKFGAAVKIQRNRIDGILHWDSQNMCRLDNIPYTIDVRVGDILITSGLGGVYPKGLKTGVVTKISKSKNELFQNILVEPYTDFYRLEEVFVLIP
jgi:rod shape-determining protein MreC